MSTFTPNPALGTWSSYILPDDLTSAKNVASVRVALEALGNKLVRALDAVSGGIIQDDFELNGTGAFFTIRSGNGTLHKTGSILSVEAGCIETHINEPTFLGGFDASAGTFTFGASAVELHNNKPEFADGALLTGTGKSVDAGAGVTWGLAGPMNLSGLVSLTSAGHVRERHALAAAGVDVTTNIETFDAVRFDTLTGDQFVKVTNTGANTGDEFEVSLKTTAGSHNLAVKRDDGTTLITLRGDNISGSLVYAKLWHNGADWYVADFTANP